jgi:hypothetical protein
MEERKQEEPLNPDSIEDLDAESTRLAQESKILKDIYGAKITQRVIWMFESPVEMVEKRPIGSIGSSINKIMGGKYRPEHKHIMGMGKMHQYYDEDDDDVDEGLVKYEMVGRKRFQVILNEDFTNIIENEYQTFLKSGKPIYDTYLDFNDIYYFVFRVDKFSDGKPYLQMTVTNTTTQALRELRRNTKLNGPFLEVKAVKWMITNNEDSEDEVVEVDGQTAQIVNRCYEKATEKQKIVAKAITYQGKQSVLYVDHTKALGKKPFIMAMSQPDYPRITLRYRDKITRWDFLSTFVPPEDLTIETG